MSIDRRAAPRRDQTFSVLVETPARRFRQCVARNVSAAGIFLQTEDPIPLDCPIRLYFAVSDEERGIAACGMVQNSRPADEPAQARRSGDPGMGVRFTRFENGGDRRLRLTLGQHVH